MCPGKDLKGRILRGRGRIKSFHGVYNFTNGIMEVFILGF
ncbi:hypothetical protein DCCM_4701 [Desulfocucumis palustris]|uniref:Uncharacterized protein n=1 Tax=Desulfocucumis palustris TaxID=1898651 RepID=A0A2L2XHG6_9FIRM|nr:hypothetical protein DCCM_4701 [Desulfocucumis palustris]